jgi:hypothetical protein
MADTAEHLTVDHYVIAKYTPVRLLGIYTGGLKTLLVIDSRDDSTEY